MRVLVQSWPQVFLCLIVVIKYAHSDCDNPLGFGPGCEEDVWASSGGSAAGEAGQPLQGQNPDGGPTLDAASRLGRFLSSEAAAAAHAAEIAFFSKGQGSDQDPSGDPPASESEPGGQRQPKSVSDDGALVRGLVTAACLLAATRYCIETLHRKKLVDNGGSDSSGVAGAPLSPHLVARQVELEAEAAALQAAAATPLTHYDPRASLTPDQERAVQGVLFAQQAALR